MSNSKKLADNWVVYMIECDDQSLYTGITTDLPRRFKQHRSAKGAKYFNFRQAIKVVYAEFGFDRSTASKRETAIKRLGRIEKIALIGTSRNQIDRLSQS